MIMISLLALACGISSGVLSAAGQSNTAIVIVFAHFAMLPIITVGLGYGTRNASIAALCGVFTVISITDIFSGCLYGITIAFPCWFVVRHALLNRKSAQGYTDWYPVGYILSNLVGYGAMVLILAATVSFDTENGFRGVIDKLIADIFERRLTIGGQLNVSDLKYQIVSFFPSIAVVVWLLILSLNSVFAQAILTWKGVELRPTPSYSNLTAPEWLYWALVASATIALIGKGPYEYVGRNLAIVFAAPFFYIGLGIIHGMVRRIASPNLALTAFYIFVIILGWPILVVAGLGFFEPWINLRRRYDCQNTDAQEEKKWK